MWFVRVCIVIDCMQLLPFPQVSPDEERPKAAKKAANEVVTVVCACVCACVCNSCALVHRVLCCV